MKKLFAHEHCPVDRQRQRDLAAGDLETAGAVAIEMHGNRIVRLAIKIAADRRDHTPDIGRAARATMPGPAIVLAAAFQRVLVEEF